MYEMRNEKQKRSYLDKNLTQFINNNNKNLWRRTNRKIATKSNSAKPTHKVVTWGVN